MKIKMKSKKIRGVMSAAALLLALTLPPAAHGQSDGPFSNADGFFSNADGVRNGYNGGSWNNVNGGGNGGSWNGISGGGNGVSWNDVNGDGDGAAWNGMEDETPVGGGLLVLTAAGVCYAAARVKRLKSKE
ncbi:MAG: hypothetical protein MJZ85_08345 [Bacteroidales bacterium]|nr:hypothetical protein [Bacteroidales bacterium]